MLSQERRIERYRIIYTWKVLEGKVPDCGLQVEENLWLGRLCKLPPLKHCSARVQTLRENSFQVQGPKLFNSLPSKLRNLSKCSIDEFKFELDQFLQKIPDEPNIPGIQYTPRACCQVSGKPSNKLVDQIKLLTTGGNLSGG